MAELGDAACRCRMAGCGGVVKWLSGLLGCCSFDMCMHCEGFSRVVVDGQ